MVSEQNASEEHISQTYKLVLGINRRLGKMDTSLDLIFQTLQTLETKIEAKTKTRKIFITILKRILPVWGMNPFIKWTEVPLKNKKELIVLLFEQNEDQQITKEFVEMVLDYMPRRYSEIAASLKQHPMISEENLSECTIAVKIGRDATATDVKLIPIEAAPERPKSIQLVNEIYNAIHSDDSSKKRKGPIDNPKKRRKLME